jgi:hypothetical protein
MPHKAHHTYIHALHATQSTSYIHTCFTGHTKHIIHTYMLYMPHKAHHTYIHALYATQSTSYIHTMYASSLSFAYTTYTYMYTHIQEASSNTNPAWMCLFGAAGALTSVTGYVCMCAHVHAMFSILHPCMQYVHLYVCMICSVYMNACVHVICGTLVNVARVCMYLCMHACMHMYMYMQTTCWDPDNCK